MADTYSLEYEWVAARYTGEQAKYTSGLANEGIGYYVLSRPDAGSAWIEAAFRRPTTEPRPDHLQPILDQRLINKLEAWRNG